MIITKITEFDGAKQSFLVLQSYNQNKGGSMDNPHKSMQNMIITFNNILICWNMHK
jgi:hypothetical protein